MSWRIILLPLSLLYYVIIFIRNKFYDYNIFKIYDAERPVISIGNISVGGTGKTPFVIFLSKLLLNQGKKVAIISRGYKRKSKDDLIIFYGENILSQPDKCGDEISMVAENLKSHKNLVIAVGSDRFRIAKKVIQEYDSDVIILDDAFQHRKIKRNLDIVLLDSNDMLKNPSLYKLIIPAGNLRESWNELKRADIIIQNDKFHDNEIIDYLHKYRKEVHKIKYNYEGVYDNNGKTVIVENKSAILFCGIAKPESFINAIEESGINIKQIIFFGDHFEYSERDILNLKNIYNKNDVFITTEKDFVKIRTFGDFITQYPVYYLKIGINILSDVTKFQYSLNQLFKLTVSPLSSQERGWG
jgi:tetraacyldisaccharide 4'-kinase